MDTNDYIVVPAYNEATRIPDLLRKMEHLGYEHVVLVDDGSTDGTAEVAAEFNVHLIKHPVNLGVGAATQTGITFALNRGAKYIVTLDADNQHSPDDIEALLTKIKSSPADLVIGSRFMKADNEIPFTRIIYNKIGNFVTFIMSGEVVTDSQSGMKVMSRHFAKSTALNCNGFEFCVEMIRNAHRKRCIIEEIPISVIYTKETMEKGQSFLSGVKMLGRLVRMNFFG